MARIIVDTEFPRFPVERKLFGHFTEHAFQNIYGGMYDPKSPLADADGLRTDVLQLLRDVNVPIIRYPGGNFVSNYHWQDGIGPKDQRKWVFEYAWLTEESNQFGTADFINLCRKVGAQPLICVNMGSGTPEEAMHWVEYCNGTGDTYYANLRRFHGYPEPFGVKYWGVGNEMYGNWQMQNLSAEDYAKYAFQFCKAIKWADPTVKLIACGLQTDSDWNHTVIKAIGPMVDYISAHRYAIGWGPFTDGDYLQSLYIPDHIEMLNRLTMSAVNTGMNTTDHRIKVAWDEWNMFGWAIDGVDDDARYTLHNTIVTALVLNMMIRNSDTIGMANYSTFVNINGAVSTHGDETVRRAQYAAFRLLSTHLGEQVLDARVVAPMLTIPPVVDKDLGRPPLGLQLMHLDADEARPLQVSALDCTATMDADGTVYLSIINKSPDTDLHVDIDFRGMTPAGRRVESMTITAPSLGASNTLHHPNDVTIRDGSAVSVEEGTLSVMLPKHSVNMIVVRAD